MKNINTTKCSIDRIIDVLQAIKAGKPIQVRLSTGWCDESFPSLNFDAWEYRVKPEPPKEFWVHKTALVVDFSSPPQCQKSKWYHVREVTEE